MASQDLDVRDKVRGGVVVQSSERPRTAGAALIEDNNAPEVRVEEAAVHRARAGTRAAMQEQHRAAVRVAGLLPVHHMSAGQGQIAGFVGADLREQVAAGHDSIML